MKNLTWQNPEQLFVAQVLINKVKSKCCGIKDNVSAIIYTQQISRQFQLDIDRHNAQYAPIDVETFRLSHDRFLCIDDDVYHIGASIKDLGKKWFGFSKMEILTPDELVERINKG